MSCNSAHKKSSRSNYDARGPTLSQQLRPAAAAIIVGLRVLSQSPGRSLENCGEPYGGEINWLEFRSSKAAKPRPFSSRAAPHIPRPSSCLTPRLAGLFDFEL